jgi:hypothetical protein
LTRYTKSQKPQENLVKPLIKLSVEITKEQGQQSQQPARLVVELNGQYRGYVALDATPSIVHCGLVLAGYHSVIRTRSWGQPLALELGELRQSPACECHVDDSVKGEYGRIELVEKHLVGIGYRTDIFVNGRGQWELADTELNLTTLSQIIRINGFDVSAEEREAQLLESADQRIAA